MLMLATCLAASSRSAAAANSSIAHPESGIRLLVVRDQAYPTLRILLPQQADAARGIEVEFPEHVWGRHRDTKEVEQLYMFRAGTHGETGTAPPAYTWRVEVSAVAFEMNLRDQVTMRARAELEADGVRFSYEFVNLSATEYQEFQPVTCVKLYNAFIDEYLERTYVYHEDGFDLLASETPERVDMSRDEWLPCRYLVSYTWPVKPEGQRIEVRENGVTFYHKSRRVAAPLLATISLNGRWVAATHTGHSGNVWSNPERTCQHVDPSVELGPGETQRLELKTYVFEGGLADLLLKTGDGSGSTWDD